MANPDQKTILLERAYINLNQFALNSKRNRELTEMEKTLLENLLGFGKKILMTITT